MTTFLVCLVSVYQKFAFTVGAAPDTVMELLKDLCLAPRWIAFPERAKQFISGCVESQHIALIWTLITKSVVVVVCLGSKVCSLKWLLLFWLNTEMAIMASVHLPKGNEFG